MCTPNKHMVPRDHTSLLLFLLPAKQHLHQFSCFFTAHPFTEPPKSYAAIGKMRTCRCADMWIVDYQQVRVRIMVRD